MYVLLLNLAFVLPGTILVQFLSSMNDNGETQCNFLDLAPDFLIVLVGFPDLYLKNKRVLLMSKTKTTTYDCSYSLF